MITITILSLIIIIIIIIIILFLAQQEPDSIRQRPAKHEVSDALETPGTLYQPSESSSDSEETVRETRSSRDKLNKFLASRNISPVRSQLKMPWDMASDRTQRFHIRKAKHESKWITKTNLIYYGGQNGFRNLAKLASWSYSVQV